jgi:putative sigma-54 modulation protein
MQISVTFKNFDSSEALRSYVQSRLEKLDKLLDAPVEANVVLCVEKIRHIAEVTLIGDKLSLHATEESDSMYSSIDMAADKIKGQIKKSKEKVRERRPVSKNGIKAEAPEAGEEDDEMMESES